VVKNCVRPARGLHRHADECDRPRPTLRARSTRVTLAAHPGDAE
jgi:hypothetical protein